MYEFKLVTPPWSISKNCEFCILVRSYSWWMAHKEELFHWAENEQDEISITDKTFIKIYVTTEQQLTYFTLRWG